MKQYRLLQIEVPDEQLVIRSNNMCLDDRCCLCGKIFTPEWGKQVFTEKTNQPVCEKCVFDADVTLWCKWKKQLASVIREFKKHSRKD